MPCRSQSAVDLEAGMIARHLERWIDPPQIERGRIAAQGLVAALAAILVKIRQRELAQAAIDRVTVAQHRAVGLGDRAPTAAAAKQRDDMRIIARVTVQVQDERRLTVNPQRAGGYEGAFDAMRPPLPQHFSHGEDRFAPEFVIDRDGVEKCLRLLRRGHSLEDSEFTRRKAEVLATGESDARQAGHVPNVSPLSDASRTVCGLHALRRCQRIVLPRMRRHILLGTGYERVERARRPLLSSRAEGVMERPPWRYYWQHLLRRVAYAVVYPRQRSARVSRRSCKECADSPSAESEP